MREEIMDWINCLPDGWVHAFGEDLCNDLLHALGRYQHDFVIDEIKEKYGKMRMYWHWRDIEYPIQIADQLCEVSAHIQDIIECYAGLSSMTCTRCGAPTEKLHIFNRSMEPLCDNCCN